MKVKYYDRIHNEEIEIDTNARTKHFIDKDDENLREQRQQDFERSFVSLDELMDKGFQPADNKSIEEEIARREREKRYLNSPEYRKFRKSLREEIIKVIDQMSECVKTAMYLRFFKDMSLSQIAQAMHSTKSAARENVARGCGYIKFFLDEDIKEQDKLEKSRRMQKEQAKYVNRINKSKKNFPKK